MRVCAGQIYLCHVTGLVNFCSAARVTEEWVENIAVQHRLLFYLLCVDHVKRNKECWFVKCVHFSMVTLWHKQ